MKVPVHSVYNTMYCGELTLGGEENIFLTVFFDTSSRQEITSKQIKGNLLSLHFPQFSDLLI